MFQLAVVVTSVVRASLLSLILLLDNSPGPLIVDMVKLFRFAHYFLQTRSKMIQLMIDNGRALYDGKPLLSEVKF